MKRRLSGHISFVSSEAGQFAVYGYCAFAPTKFALRCVVAHMKRRLSGHISFASSEAGQFAVYGYCAFAPTKFALRGLADALQMELMPYNINVSVLYPPNTDSESFRKQAVERTEEMRLISDTGGLFTPKQVAEAHIKDIEAGQYSTSVGLNGWILSELYF
ncbi:3-ketodihydrosphingosine reductase domain protein [Oesophagostomum dentatum]|uniref:3-ketodihydrosphingosine reductase domain protein n=1 Tax=Oesophagostomum dentatum TaxID=61180 RepID=A0A0B1SAY5_OESDE|nr:3-ketodihydrosphingosine reductase domain protein [Oesophagostomum dentatum]